MPSTWSEVDTWWDLANNLWIGLVAVAVIVIPVYFGQKQKDQLKKIGGETSDIKDQVVNGHSGAPPLRSDMDKVLLSLDNLTTKVDGLAQDVREEREERRSNIDHLRKDLDGRFRLLQEHLNR